LEYTDMFFLLNKAFPLGLALITANPAGAFVNEEIPAGESQATQQIAQMVEADVRLEAKNGMAHRDAHPKAHGCVQAEFRVLPDLPEAMRVGLFAQARAYTAWIRYSNASGKAQNDSVGDARGMAVKLMGVEGSESGTQDFLMINHPVFVVRNAADYVEFQKSMSAGSPAKFFFPGMNPLNFRLHEFGIAMAIQGKDVANLLDSRYWSTTPYRFGATAMKFSARPCGPISAFAATATPDFLRENLREHLASKEACFDFQVQRQTLPGAMPIEDPTVEWSEQDSPFISVGRITIPAQTFLSAKQLSVCENLSFTPGHAIPAHQPLGGINRVRKTVYDTVSQLRHALNGEQRREPANF
jgi:hypothetical protein